MRTAGPRAGRPAHAQSDSRKSISENRLTNYKTGATLPWFGGTGYVALKGTNQEFGRPYNRRLVLESIRLHGPTSRSDIATRLGLTFQTVSTIVRELEEQNYVLSTREEPKGRGAPATALRINPEGGYAIGINATPLGVEAGLIDFSGNIVATLFSEQPNPQPDATFGEIGRMAEKLQARRPGGRMLGAGMVLPGPFDIESMAFVGPTAMTGWKGVALKERLAEATGLPAFVGIDLAAAALGEQLYGLGRELSDYYYLYFGVGLGGAMVHDGAVLRGGWGNAGEIGHVPLVSDGEACPCGNRGCLERHVSLEAWRRSGASEQAWTEEVAPIFRNAIVMIENLFDPQTVVIGGMAPASLLDRFAALAPTLPNSVSARQTRTLPRIVASGGGEHAILRGAAALAVSGVLSPRHGQMFAERDGTDPTSNGDIAA